MAPAGTDVTEIAEPLAALHARGAVAAPVPASELRPAVMRSGHFDDDPPGAWAGRLAATRRGRAAFAGPARVPAMARPRE
jgi:hypothetical protein